MLIVVKLLNKDSREVSGLGDALLDQDGYGGEKCFPYERRKVV